MESIEANGTKLAYLEQGAGEPVVLVHANISDHRSWEPLLPALREKYRAIAYSRRGHWPNAPLSDSINDLWERELEDLAALIVKLGASPAHVVGNSAGAVLALMLARRHPHLVRSLVIEEAPLMTVFTSYPPRAGEMIRMLLSRPAQAFGIMDFGIRGIVPGISAFRRGRDEEGLRAFVLSLRRRGCPLEIGEDRWEQMRANLGPHKVVFADQGLPQFFEADVRQVKAPTLLVAGERSALFLRHIAERLAAVIPGAESLRVQGAAHFVHEDNPAAVAGAILDFFGRHRESSGAAA